MKKRKLFLISSLLLLFCNSVYPIVHTNANSSISNDKALLDNKNKIEIISCNAKNEFRDELKSLVFAKYCEFHQTFSEIWKEIVNSLALFSGKLYSTWLSVFNGEKGEWLKIYSKYFPIYGLSDEDYCKYYSSLFLSDYMGDENKCSEICLHSFFVRIWCYLDKHISDSSFCENDVCEWRNKILLFFDRMKNHIDAFKLELFDILKAEEQLVVNKLKNKNSASFVSDRNIRAFYLKIDKINSLKFLLYQMFHCFSKLFIKNNSSVDLLPERIFGERLDTNLIFLCNAFFGKISTELDNLLKYDLVFSVEEIRTECFNHKEKE